jgi:hypothetical protein
MIPRNKPTIEAIYEKKFKKIVDGRIFMTIKNGRMAPSRTHPKPIRIRYSPRIVLIFI